MKKRQKKPQELTPPKKEDTSPEAVLYPALYAAYAHHCDSQHNEPDKIADVAIVDKALEETGIDMPFSDAMSYYRQVEGRLYRNTTMGKACGRPAQICRKRARPEACYSEIQREFRVKVAGSGCSCRYGEKSALGRAGIVTSKVHEL